jgi:hypothetical protein
VSRKRILQILKVPSARYTELRLLGFTVFDLLGSNWVTHCRAAPSFRPTPGSERYHSGSFSLLAL